jgi:hypothetical protein
MGMSVPTSEAAGQENATGELLGRYRTVAADLRRCLMLADIAADHGHTWRAVGYLTSALDELAPDLAALRSPPSS